MRRGEVLNLTWADIDFERQSVEVEPKADTPHTWEWRIKDYERRTLPLTDALTALLADRQAEQRVGCPYVVLPPWRYERLQQRRTTGPLPERDRKCPLNNFTKHWQEIMAAAKIEGGEFYDLRRTTLTEWLANGLSEYEVMRLAGHSDFQTTHRFYLAVRRDLIDRARQAIGPVFGAHLARAPERTTENPVFEYPRQDSNLQLLAPEANALSN